MNAYIIHLKTGSRQSIRIKTTAPRVAQAVRQVLDFEGAPFRAVQRVRRLGPIFVEQRS